MKDLLTIVGLGVGDGPPADLAKHLAFAHVVVGGSRQLAEVPAQWPGERLRVSSPLDALFDAIADHMAAGRAVLALCDGDPLFFGLGTRLVERFPTARVIPGLSVHQAACAYLGRSTLGTACVSLHGRASAEPLYTALTRAPTGQLVGCYTDATHNAAHIAKLLIERGADPQTTYLHCFERLHMHSESSGERVRSMPLAEAAALDPASINEPHFILLEHTAPPALTLHPGMASDDYAATGRCVTKRAVRAVAVALLAPCPGDVVWDVGAGTGSVGLEASLHADTVVAMEAREDRYHNLRANIAATRALNVRALHGHAPQVFAQLDDLPAPSAIFIGGGLTDDPAILHAALDALAPGGRLVASAVLLETLATITHQLPHADIQQVLTTATRPLRSSTSQNRMLSSDSAVFLASVTKDA